MNKFNKNLYKQFKSYTVQKYSKSTFENQSKLPRLPVPSLENLSQKYKASVTPLLSKEEYTYTCQVVDKFVDGVGKVLQSRLVEYDLKQSNSWLEDIWLNKAYLEWRDPTLINVNWWCQFKDIPAQTNHLMSHPPPKRVLTELQIDRAANLVTRMLDFKSLVDKGLLPPEMIKDAPLCMNQYKNQFGTARLPGNTCDSLYTPFPCDSKHIIVSIGNQLYPVQVINEQGERIAASELKRLLYAASKDRLESNPEPPIGLLTAGHRDTWYQAHSALVELNEQNKENLRLIQESIFVLCLDDFSSKKNIDSSHLQIFHGTDARNRWFDKAIQLIVASNGRAGVNGEHSPADAVIPGNLMDYILVNELVQDYSGAKNFDLPVKLKWQVNEKILGLILEAENTALGLINDTESCLLQTDIYGSRYIKEVAKASPDSFIQLALQATWRRLNKEPTAVYETASTRRFLHGRTETCRSLTTETWAFADNLDNDDMLFSAKVDLFKAALQSQSNYMREASLGRGIDRHLLGLRCMIQDSKEAEQAEIYKDVAYARSSHFKLSTSNMSPGINFYGGFGPVYPDGYGINYAIDQDFLRFSISSKNSCATTNAREFRATLLRTLKDMIALSPKRSEVWGFGWKEKQNQEAKEDYLFKKMKKLSQIYSQKAKDAAKEYEK